MVAIDTNIAIAYLKNELVLPSSIRVEDFILPVTVAGEMLFGAKNSGRPEANLLAYRSFIHDLQVLLLDGLAAEYYAEIRLSLKQKGRPIPENDMWIAAICRAHEVPLLTYDRHFAEVPGLQLFAI
jgi:tRNA(fMet)-specific endonuclease VapC